MSTRLSWRLIILHSNILLRRQLVVQFGMVLLSSFFLSFCVELICAWWNFKDACSGSNDGINTLQGRSINVLRRMYSNCTVVIGNLELVNIKEKDLMEDGLSTLDFLGNIEEVMGYVIIQGVKLRSLALPKLKIIWGDELFRPNFFPADAQISEHLQDPFGLYIHSNSLEILDLRSLVSVHNGNVLVEVNSYLCYLPLIDWRQILSSKARLINTMGRKNHESCNTGSVLCSALCAENRCWGPEPFQCQQLYRHRLGCAPQCSDGMCFRDDKNPQFCCHSQCAGGCVGPKSENCLICRGFRNGNDCVDVCPPIRKYNPATGEKYLNPEGRYHYNRWCVEKCPANMLIDYDSCVTRCKEDHYQNDKRECIPCVGPCPKRCTIRRAVHSYNIKDFENCTEVDGFIEILQSMTDRYLDYVIDNRTGQSSQIVYPALTVADLDVLQNVRVVTQYVNIQLGNSERSPGPRSLSFLRNLETIDGRLKFESIFALYIAHTSLNSLDLVNLKQVRDGKILLSNNNELCYSHNIPFDRIANGPEGYVNKTKPFRDRQLCARENSVCDASCVPELGCWGPGSNRCFACRNFKLDGACVDSCLSSDNLFQVADKVCQKCHPDCLDGCNGPGADQCRSCRSFKDGNVCVAECPKDSYANDQNKCQPCHRACSKKYPGCTGPSNIAGEGGCNRCTKAVLLLNSTWACESEELISWTGCFASDPLRRQKFENFYIEIPRTSAEKSKVDEMFCKVCHPMCRSCSTFGAIPGDSGNNCTCKEFFDSTQNVCVEKCANDRYAKSLGKPYMNCFPCHNECDSDAGCTGPNSTDCRKCKHFHVFLDDTLERVDCMSECPPWVPFPNDDRICLATDVLAVKQREQYTKIGLGVGTVIVLVAVVCVIAFLIYRRRVDLRLRFAVPDLDLKPNPKAKPNLSYFHIINEADLRRGGELGAGAFGKVYKGVWVCPLENGGVKKRPVAIKVLHEASPTAVNEMLEEAANMASMHHQHLVPLLGMCVGSQMMLVTPLMPLGNLLEYVQNNKGSGQINSVHMMRWCRQIAEGMAYLEDHRLVHRDLAARNVLVQTPYVLRITDFGLAKMLDYGQDEYKAAGGKMPIKWLALECIKHRTFTHKSDVWAFAVTVWEILSFGEKPYENVPVKDLFNRIENGDRLPQMPTMTMDFYVLLIRCWMVDADSRPSFKELVEIFENWSSDPGRYIVIQGDRFGHLDNLTRDEMRERLREAVNLGEMEDIDDEEYYSSSANGAMPSTPVKNGGPADRRAPFGSNNQRNHSTGSSRYGPEPKHFAAKHPNLQSDDNYLIPRCNLSQSGDLPSLSNSAVTAVMSDRGIPYTEVVSLSPGSNENSFNLGSPPPYYNYFPTGTSNDSNRFKFDCEVPRNVSAAPVDLRKRNGNGNSLDNKEYMQPGTNGLYVNDMKNSRELLENETVV